MADLSAVEKRVFERLFEMGGGYVCDFSNRTFAEFVLDTTGIDIYQEKYEAAGTSKANRLRTFWRLEKNRVVAVLLEGMLEYYETESIIAGSQSENAPLLTKARDIVERLGSGSDVEDIDALSSAGSDPKSVALARLIQESVEQGRPEEALDRLHTFLIGYVRGLCRRHSIAFDKRTPLHALFGSYVRFLRENHLVDARASLTILKSSIHVLDDLNAVRNDQSLAHDNQLLNRNEATLIFRHISSAVKFIQELEKRIQEAKAADEVVWQEPEFSDEELEAAGDAWIQSQMDIERGK